MALKDKWKTAGKGIGGAFKNFGKAVQTTARVALDTQENTVDENGETALRSAWKKTGKGFGEAGKSLGKAAQGTAQKVVGKEQSEDAPKEETPVEEAPTEEVPAEQVEVIDPEDK